MAKYVFHMQILKEKHFIATTNNINEQHVKIQVCKEQFHIYFSRRKQSMREYMKKNKTNK